MQTVLEQMLSKYKTDNVEEKKNAFTKKMDKVGELTDRKRVMVFADDDNAIDTKTHFEHIAHKIDLSAEGFIKAVEDAIAIKLGAAEDQATKKTTTKKKSAKKSEPVVEEPEIVEDSVDEQPPFDIEETVDIFDEDEMITLDSDRLTAIRAAFKGASDDVKAAVKKHLVEYGNKLSATMKAGDVRAIEEKLGLLEEEIGRAHV